MKINWNGRDWEFDESAITVKQGIAIHLAHHITIAEFSQGLVTLDPRAIQAGYWLMLQQNGEIKPIADCDFAALQWSEAYANGRLAEMEEEKAQAEAKAAAEAVAMVPTSPPSDAPASPGPASQTATTRRHRDHEPPSTGS